MTETKPNGDPPIHRQPNRQPYEKPSLTRVDLAVAETLSEGCKLGSDPICVGPPVTAFSGGS